MSESPHEVNRMFLKAVLLISLFVTSYSQGPSWPRLFGVPFCPGLACPSVQVPHQCFLPTVYWHERTLCSGCGRNICTNGWWGAQQQQQQQTTFTG
ncbi:hypothetical protein ScPMuIL_015787 [Solemya velum]